MEITKSKRKKVVGKIITYSSYIFILLIFLWIALLWIYADRLYPVNYSGRRGVSNSMQEYYQEFRPPWSSTFILLGLILILFAISLIGKKIAKTN